MSQAPPTFDGVTITFTRYAEPDWLVMDLLESLAAQRGVTGEVLFFDQSPGTTEAEGAGDLFSNGLSYRRIAVPASSLSAARNAALSVAANDTVLFIDADAIAGEDWARWMADALQSPGVGIAAGRILPKWHARPLWIARSGVVLDQYSMLDLGRSRHEVTRAVGASFGLRRDRLGPQARFDENLGRRDGQLHGGEDSDLCARAISAGLTVVYEGRAEVHHQVLPERIRTSWVLKRMYYAGRGRAQVGGAPSPSRRTGLWDYLAFPLILPPYIAGYCAARFGGSKS